MRERQIEFARGHGVAEYVLADRLHKTLGEVRAMPHTEYLSWIAYLRLEAERTNRRR